jgi:hypothetical protein
MSTICAASLEKTSMALLQRMIADEKIGFNYDFMGFSEFENGSTTRARAELAGFMLDGTMTARRVNFKGTWGVTKVKFPAIVIGEKKFVDQMKPELSVTMEKGFMRDQDEDILGWMVVDADYNKIFILRDDGNYPANIDRLEKFLKPFAGQITQSRKKAA